MIAAMLLVAALFGPGDVCDGLDSGKIDINQDGVQSVTVVAPDGYLIGGYCVKAGSSKQDNGPVYVVIDPGVTEVTITHPSGKDISHYSYTLVKEVPPSTTTTTSPTTSTTTVPPTTTTTTTTTMVTTVPSSTTSTTVTPTTFTTSTMTTSPSSTTVPPTTTTGPSTEATPTMTELPRTGPNELLLVLAAAGFFVLVLGALFVWAGRRGR